ncbi:hypothetical protein [Vibrio vulnificus]|uniref:hypothetical protein n=1 Tax=Vibrio vulnificus TaxID=672 RepID=UPI0010231EC8|nr:hypothetical protein [Vibrio vulnificus]RZQ33223.1 hypothetical protein D8T38_18445 [Vibrio vulnificus]
MGDNRYADLITGSFFGQKIFFFKNDFGKLPNAALFQNPRAGPRGAVLGQNPISCGRSAGHNPYILWFYPRRGDWGVYLLSKKRAQKEPKYATSPCSLLQVKTGVKGLEKID